MKLTLRQLKTLIKEQVEESWYEDIFGKKDSPEKEKDPGCSPGNHVGSCEGCRAKTSANPKKVKLEALRRMIRAAIIAESRRNRRR